MSLENKQTQETSKNIPKEKEPPINIQTIDQNLLFRPIPIKQNTLNKNQIINLDNTFTTPPPPVSLYQNSLQSQYINNENNKLNYIQIKEQENHPYIKNINTPIEISKSFPNDKGGAFSFFNLNNSNNAINDIKPEQNNLQNSKVHCTCKKTKCIKKYCECFSSGNKCFNCKCENCENKPYYIENASNKKKEEENEENIELNEDGEEKLIICTCSKSGCNKNYCECFKAKVKCNNKCRCIKCLNKSEDNQPQIEENKIIMRSKSTPINISSNNTSTINNINNNNIPEINNSSNNNNNINDIANNFTVHRISVVINKAQTIINTEKLDLYDSHKFLNKKRNMK